MRLQGDEADVLPELQEVVLLDRVGLLAGSPSGPVAIPTRLSDDWDDFEGSSGDCGDSSPNRKAFKGWAAVLRDVDFGGECEEQVSSVDRDTSSIRKGVTRRLLLLLLPEASRPSPLAADGFRRGGTGGTRRCEVGSVFSFAADWQASAFGLGGGVDTDGTCDTHNCDGCERASAPEELECEEEVSREIPS